MLRYVTVDLTLRQRHFEREKTFVFRSNAGQSKLTALKAKNVRRFCVCVCHLSLSCTVFIASEWPSPSPVCPVRLHVMLWKLKMAQYFGLFLRLFPCCKCMKYEILSMLILWSISGSTVALCLDRIRRDYIVRLRN